MSNVEPIVVDDFATLLPLLQSCECWVEWRVLCDIGPDWIGRGRIIQFYLDQRPLADTPFHRQLQNALISKLHLPKGTSDAVIRGEGTVTRDAHTLTVEYDWTEAVPYMDARDRGYGKISLLAIP